MNRVVTFVLVVLVSVLVSVSLSVTLRTSAERAAESDGKAAPGAPASMQIESGKTLGDLEARIARIETEALARKLPDPVRVPVAASCSGTRPLTDPAVPTGMNTGVSTWPCGVTIRPSRAWEAGSEARTENSNMVAM